MAVGFVWLRDLNDGWVLNVNHFFFCYSISKTVSFISMTVGFSMSISFVLLLDFKEGQFCSFVFL